MRQAAGDPDITCFYFGRTPPGTTRTLFESRFVSTGLDELNSVFSPDGREFYFCIRNIIPPLYYFVCDDAGRFFARTYKEDLIFTIKNDKLYSMNQDDEEGNPHIRRYRMTWEMR